MKKIVSIFIAISVVVSLLGITVSATYEDHQSTTYVQKATNAYDLTAYGVHLFQAYKVSQAPVPDGIISTGEYPAASDVATLGDGLSLTSKDGAIDYSDYASDYANHRFQMTSYLAYDGEYAYIAEVLDTKIPLDKKTNFDVIFSYGLNQSPLYPEAVNSIFYHVCRYTNDPASPTDTSFSSVVSSKRITRSLTQNAQTNITLNRNNTNKNAYVDGNGTTWTFAEYEKPENTSALVTEDGGTYSYTFEYRIPLGDLLRSDPEGHTAEELINNVFFGNYFFTLEFTANGGASGSETIALSTGLSGAAEIQPHSSTTEGPSTFKKAFEEFWPASNGGQSIITYVGSPVWHVGVLDPSSNPVVTSVFRPEASGYKVNANLTGVRIGKPLTFTMISDGMDILPPVVYDLRYVPSNWEIRYNNTTVASGKPTNTSGNEFTVNVDTSTFKVGLHTLIATYSIEQWDGSQWVQVSTKNFQRSFTVTGTVLAGADGPADQTGDSWNFVLVAVGAMFVCTTAFVVVTRRKRVK